MSTYRGWNAKLYKDSVQIGYVKEVRIDIDHSLEYYFEAGTRVAATTIEGPINIKGKMTKAWIDKNYLSLLSGTDALAEFDLALNVGSSAFILYLYNCKFNKGAMAVPQDGLLMEDYDFLATSFAIV